MNTKNFQCAQRIFNAQKEFSMSIKAFPIRIKDFSMSTKDFSMRTMRTRKNRRICAYAHYK